jgi:hypothetical protein
VRVLEDATTLEEAVFQAVGAASMAWENPAGAGVFDSDRAKAVGEELLAWVQRGRNHPRLGYATTLELIRELSARAETSRVDGWPNYRTVDQEEVVTNG